MSLAMIDVDGVAGWLATFALHSTLALACALLASVLLRQSAVALQEALLRWSLWAGLVSASLQCIALGSPWSRQMPWNPEPAAAALAQQAVGLLHDDPAPSFPLASAPGLVASGFPLSWQQCVVAVAIVSALAGLIGLLRTHHRLAHLLAERRPEAEPRVLTTAADVAAALGLRQSPRMSRSDRLATPIAFGLLRPEICLPARVDALGDESLRAMLAHELTHLRHADPAWMWAATWLQALFPWQLLLVAARRRWARLIELRCDAVAARHASSTAVARCLLDIAEWLRPTAPGPLVALGMASRPSALRERVEAALVGSVDPRPRWRSAFVAGGTALAALTFAAPGWAPQAVTRTPAPESAAADQGSPAVGELLERLAHEEQQLRDEAERLGADLAGQRLSPELEQLQAALARRLFDLARLRARLTARLDRLPAEAR